MDQETITEAPGNDSGADTSAGILSEADLASSFLERVEEQPEEKPSETEATDQTSEDDVAEAKTAEVYVRDKEREIENHFEDARIFRGLAGSTLVGIRFVSLVLAGGA